MQSILIYNCTILLVKQNIHTLFIHFSLGTGQLVFDILGQTEIQGVKNVTNSLSEALVQLGKQDKDVRLRVQREIWGEGEGAE